MKPAYLKKQKKYFNIDKIVTEKSNILSILNSILYKKVFKILKNPMWYPLSVKTEQQSIIKRITPRIGFNIKPFGAFDCKYRIFYYTYASIIVKRRRTRPVVSAQMKQTSVFT